MNSAIIQQIGAVLTAILGILAISSPKSVEVFVSIQAVGKSGISEIRATYGGFFLGIAMFAIYRQETVVFLALGIGWLMAALVRTGTLIFGFYTNKNAGGVAFELALGLMCLSSLYK